MKKVIFVLLAIITVSMSAYSADFSIGATIGWSPTFGRGEDYEERIIGNNVFKPSFKYDMAFFQIPDIKLFVDFTKYFGIEVGVGAAMKSISYGVKQGEDKIVYRDIVYPIYIPTLLKVQYEIADLVNIYFGAGVRFNFNIAANRITYINDKETENTRLKEKNFNRFDIDINATTVGLEFKLAKVHYLGLRFAYDVNLLGSFRHLNADNNWVTSKMYLDDIAVSLTYRYKFINNLK